MKKIHNLSLLLMFSMLAGTILSGCITINFPGQGEPTGVLPSPVMAPTAMTIPATPVVQIPSAVPPQAIGGLTDEVLLNGEYLSPVLQVPIQLVNGKFDGTANGTELHAVIQPGIAYGDLNGDGIQDAAMLLSENTGGSGIFVSLVVVFSREGMFQNTPGYTIDDRPVINNLLIENGVVKVGGLIHGPNDPMVDPTTRVQADYSLLGGRMILTRLTSAFKGGAEHAIFIDSPLDGEVITDSFRLRGTMPIGPFENNLLLTISDPLSGELVHEGFMVQSADMGAPATFDNILGLPDVPAGTQVLLALSELSMADGTPMAVDSVLVTLGQ